MISYLRANRQPPSLYVARAPFEKIRYDRARGTYDILFSRARAKQPPKFVIQDYSHATYVSYVLNFEIVS